MKKISFLFLVTAILILARPLIVAAESVSAKEMPSEQDLNAGHQFTGVVLSFSDTEITANNDEGKSSTFKIDDKTKIIGKIAVDKKISITYTYLKIFKAYLVKKALVIKVMEEKKK